MNPTLRAVVERHLALEIDAVRRIDDGWDYIVFEVNGEWIVRVPRRADVREWFRGEAVLLEVLAEALPVRVPEPVAIEDRDLSFMVYRKLEGEPLTSALTPRHTSLARELGAFLAALHGLSPARAFAGDVVRVDWVGAREAFVRRCKVVFPLLDEDDQRRARALFDRQRLRLPDELVVLHGDLGPEHILVRRDAVTAVIDWSDARLGDPALDFAWLLHGPPESFGEALLSAYAAAGGRIDAQLRDRALYFHRIGPWHEVLFGLEHGRPDMVESGLAGVRARLP